MAFDPWAAMNDRQREHYNDLFDIYRAPAITTTVGKGVDDPGAFVLVASNVPARWQTTDNRNNFKAPLGRTQDEIFDTEDQVHFVFGQDVRDADILQVKTPGHVQYGETLKVLGFGETRQSPEANYSHVKTIRSLPPGRGIPVLTP